MWVPSAYRVWPRVYGGHKIYRPIFLYTHRATVRYRVLSGEREVGEGRGGAGAPPRAGPVAGAAVPAPRGQNPKKLKFLRKTELSKGDLQRNSRSQCPTCSMLVLCVPISSHCGALALCRLSLGLDQPRRLPSRDQVEVASCQSSAQWPRSQARLSPNLRSPRSSST